MAKDSIQKTIRVGYTQGDRFARMTPGSILREAQEISMEHCDGLGFSVPEMLRYHRVFLLAKLHMTIHRAPVEGETVKVTTRGYAPKRIIYRRETTFDTPEGERLVTVDTRWALVNTETRRITRDAPEGLNDMFAPPEDLTDIQTRRVECDREEAPVRVTYSMVDTNRHVNNTFYADWICDALEPLLARGAQVKELKLIYHHEAMPGETVRIRSAVADGWRFFCGDTETGRCFDAEALLTEPVVPEGEEAPLPYYV